MRTLTVGGIDPSSSKIVIVESRRENRKKAFIHVTHLRSERIEDRMLEAFDFIVDFAMAVREREDQSPALYLEAPVQGVGGPGATIPQAFVSGSIMAGAAQTDSYIALVNNQTWKKKVLGKGNVPKIEVTPLMRDVWPVFMAKVPICNTKQHNGAIPAGEPDQDVVDAGAINMYGWKQALLVESIKQRRGMEV